MSTFRVSTRFRHVAASTGALAVAGALAVSGVVGGGAEMTEAAWSDKEAAQASVKGIWMEGFTRVTDPGWKMRGSRDSNLPNSIGLSDPLEARRNFAMSNPLIAGSTQATGTDDLRNSFGTPTSAGIVPSRKVTDDLWMGRYTTSVSGDTDIARAGHCMSYPQPTSMTATTTTCFANQVPSPRMVAHQNTLGYTFSITASGLGSKIARVNVAGFASTAQCFADGSSSASIDDASSVLQLANEVTTLNYSFNREMSIKSIIPTSDDAELRYDGTTNQWMRYNVQTSPSDPSFVLAANVRKNTYLAPFYALAEMDLIIQVYSAGGSSGANARFIDQINLPLTRSECGFSNGTESLQPMAGTWRDDTNQLGWPGRSLGTTVPSNATRLEQFTFNDAGVAPMMEGAPAAFRMEAQATPEVTAATSLPPTTTLTSPLENSTASETTTSAPPNPSGEDESTTAGTTTAATTSTTRRTTTVTSPVPTVTAGPPSTTTLPATKTLTSTSAAPAVVIPDDPGTLSPTARLEDVGTVTVGGEDFVVVTPGDTVPTDAQQGVAALEIWLGGGDPGDTWATFTSTDPAADGWRWAAINQETGTVVYVR
ncbi:MAG: hypothetical protein V7738_13430 [Dietzia maris]